MTSNNISYRVGKLEEGQKIVSDKLDLILTNHLPHIQGDLIGAKAEGRILSALNIGAIILGIIILKFFN